MSKPPRRPTDLHQLGFERRAAVRWFSPPVLARAGLKVVLASAFGDYLDKRELQQSLPDDIIDNHHHGDVWIDFVADTGDGFDPTYTVAWAMSQPTLQPDGAGRPLPRGDYLICGGDEVYPVGSPAEYEARFVGPYRAALPWTQTDHPTLLAIPGNHDWYDGLTGFMRVFGQGSWVGGRKTAQRRSYFAVALPHGHWLWGIDIQNDSYVDAAQLAYFKGAAQRMKAEDRLILCSAKPSWIELEDPDAYRNLKFVQRHLVPSSVTTVLTISGDSHLYARYESKALDKPRSLIVSGGGGAFLSATHKLPSDVAIPVAPDPTSPDSNGTDEFSLIGNTYPSADESRALTWRALLVGWRNPSFLYITAALHILLLTANSAGLRSGNEPFDKAAPTWTPAELFTGRFRSPATNVILVALFALLAAFSKNPKSQGKVPRKGWKARAQRAAFGVVHTFAHVIAHGLVAYAAIQACATFAAGFAFTIAVGTLVVIGGGAIGSIVFGAYLIAAFKFWGCHATEVFSSFRHEGYKSFLRIRVSADGVTVYVIGVDRPCKEWKCQPDAPTVEASHVAPMTPISTVLVDGPFTL